MFSLLLTYFDIFYIFELDIIRTNNKIHRKSIITVKSLIENIIKIQNSIKQINY